MSCNTFLISTPTPGLRRPHSHSERIFWATHTLPLFWLALFDEDSLVEGSNDGRGYPGLSKRTKPALLLACTGVGQGFFNTPNQTAIIGSVPREYRGFAAGLVQMLFGLGSLLGISLGGALLTQMFRHYSGMPDATPSAASPQAFVSAMNATYAVCFLLMLGAVVTSLMRGGRRVEAAVLGEKAGG